MPDLEIEDVLESEPLSLPVRLLHISSVSDGACALVLASDGVAQELHERPIWIQGHGHWTASAWFMSRQNNELAWLDYVNKAALQAYAQAGITDPRTAFDVAEVVDPFTFKEMQIIEALGLCEEGGSGKFVINGHADRDGSMPVNPSGGLLGEGNPIGAQPVLRLAWAARHIRGESGEVFPRDASRAVVAEWGGMYQYGAAVVVGDEKPVVA
jgi:acetyl-CoA C-acetyltransferase